LDYAEDLLEIKTLVKKVSRKVIETAWVSLYRMKSSQKPDRVVEKRHYLIAPITPISPHHPKSLCVTVVVLKTQQAS